VARRNAEMLNQLTTTCYIAVNGNKIMYLLSSQSKMSLKRNWNTSLKTKIVKVCSLHLTDLFVRRNYK
jgi:hypothetical protein